MLRVSALFFSLILAGSLVSGSARRSGGRVSAFDPDAEARGRADCNRDGRSLDALLPEMITLAEETAPTRGTRRFKITIDPKIESIARLEIESATRTTVLSAAGNHERLKLTPGAPAFERRVDVDASAKAATPLRVGLVFEDENGLVTMTTHREFPLDTSSQVITPATPPSIVVKDSKGNQAVTYFPAAPQPLVTKGKP